MNEKAEEILDGLAANGFDVRGRKTHYRKVNAFDANGEYQTVDPSEAILRDYVAIWLATGKRFDRDAFFLNERAYEHCITLWNTEPFWKFEAVAGGAQ